MSAATARFAPLLFQALVDGLHTVEEKRVRDTGKRLTRKIEGVKP
jgi:hypothetical protein